MNKALAHPSFEKLSHRRIESLDIDVTEYRHSKTGTPHYHLATDNPENVFLVGLRTVPTDSTGVAHILEHTVLCGSEKYPVRDPFFMMIRRSLNTFMNAFTSTDWTAYPFATQNRKDYFNLLDVYLDAVFFSRLDELDFAQEGHRVEFEDPKDPKSDLVYKGVVFNEMKGAMSAPTSALWHTLTKYVYPNNTYHYNSGGEPENILDLSYQQLKDFYDTHYHPSNAVFMTYGDIPAVELQTRFDEHVLQRFEPLERTIQVEKTQRYHAPVRVEESYASDESEIEGNTHVVVAWLLGESIDLDARLRAHLVSNVLLDNSASPLLKALETSDLGSSPSPLCGLDDSNREMLFCCGMEGSSPDKNDAIEALVTRVFEDIVENGVPREFVDAVLHQLELSQREIRGDGMPFGLQLVLGGLSSAMLRGDTMDVLDMDPALQRLREAAGEEDFIRKAVQELFLDNRHKVRLTMQPDANISSVRQAAEKQRLRDRKSSLDDVEKARIVERAEQLAQRQAQEDDPGILPQVTLDDVPEDIYIPQSQIRDASGQLHNLYEQGTNGIVYQDLLIELSGIDDDLLELLPFYTSFLCELGSAGRDYLETQSLQSSITGSFGAYALKRSMITDASDVRSYFVLSGKALLRNHEAMVKLMHETISSPRFDEADRIRELFAQTRAAREQSVTGNGHGLAMSAAASGINPVAALSHRLHGLAGIKALKELDDTLDSPQALKDVAARFERLHAAVRKGAMQHLMIAEGDNLDKLSTVTGDIFAAIDNPKSQGKAITQNFSPSRTQQLWTTSTEVNFVSSAFETVSASHDDAPALAVLGPFLRNGYLHRAIRETGGAYGGGASFDSDSASFRFYSYRDPRLEETLEDFRGSIRWLLDNEHEWRQVEEGILNVVSRIDKPGSPSGNARSAFQATLFGRDAELRKRLRKQILEVKLEDLKRVGERYFDGGSSDSPNEHYAAVTSEKTAGECSLPAEKISL